MVIKPDRNAQTPEPRPNSHGSETPDASELQTIIQAQLQEIRRGTVVLACLTLLKQERYGYALVTALEEAGFAVEQSTLYPLLRRLEKLTLLVSEWDTSESRPRKYYRTTRAGNHVAAALSTEWDTIATGLAQLAKPTDSSPQPASPSDIAPNHLEGLPQ